MKVTIIFNLLIFIIIGYFYVPNSNSDLFASDKNEGIVIIQSNPNLTMTVNGFAQARFTYYDAEYGKNQQNFNLALGRVALSGKAFHPNASYFFQIEGSTFGNSNNISFIDWVIKYKCTATGVVMQMGRIILPYSRQFYTHPGNLLFTDLSAADYAFNLPRALGVMASGSVARINYGVGVVNGIRALDSSGEVNQPGNELSYFGRLEIDILKSFGYLESSASIVEQPQLSLGIAVAVNEIDNASGFQNLKVDDKTTNLTVDGGLRIKGFVLQSAYYSRENKPADSSISDYTDWGFYIQSGIQVVPEKLEIAARYSTVEFKNLSETFEYTTGVNYYVVNHHLKVQLDYSLIKTEMNNIDNTTQDHRIRFQTQALF